MYTKALIVNVQMLYFGQHSSFSTKLACNLQLSQWFIGLFNYQHFSIIAHSCLWFYNSVFNQFCYRLYCMLCFSTYLQACMCHPPSFILKMSRRQMLRTKNCSLDYGRGMRTKQRLLIKFNNRLSANLILFVLIDGGWINTIIDRQHRPYYMCCS